MAPQEIIAIMRHKGWLKREPRSTREKITSATRYMMIKKGFSIAEFASHLDDSSPSYTRRKISEDRWKMEDLDRLPSIFGRSSPDYVGGYLRMAELDDDESEQEGKMEDVGHHE